MHIVEKFRGSAATQIRHEQTRAASIIEEIAND